MIGGKLKLKQNKKLEHALKQKRRAELTTEELRLQMEEDQKKEEEKKQMQASIKDDEDGKTIIPTNNADRIYHSTSAKRTRQANHIREGSAWYRDLVQ